MLTSQRMVPFEHLVA